MYNGVALLSVQAFLEGRKLKLIAKCVRSSLYICFESERGRMPGASFRSEQGPVK